MPISNYKTKFCRNGRQCQYGPSCHFAHSIMELQHYRAIRRRAQLIEEELCNRDVQLRQLEDKLLLAMHQFLKQTEEIRQSYRDIVQDLHDEELE